MGGRKGVGVWICGVAGEGKKLPEKTFPLCDADLGSVIGVGVAGVVLGAKNGDD